MNALDEIKKKTFEGKKLTKIELAIHWVWNDTGTKNGIAYEAAQEYTEMNAELLKLREENAQLRHTIALSAKCEEVTLYECADCNLISTTEGICAECEQPLKAVNYVSFT